MRPAIINKRHIAVAVAFTLLVIALCFAVPWQASAEDGSSLEERYVCFTYGYTDCVGDVYPCSDDNISDGIGYDTTYPTDYAVQMMICDSDHKVQVAGEGVTADNVTYVSSNTAVLDIDSEGNVTLNQTGKAEITATVEADDVYQECSVHLVVTVDRHEGWVANREVYYEGRSPLWGLDLETTDGPQQLVVPLRPGASASYSSYSPYVAYVDQNGVVTPVSAGTACIRIDVDDGGGKYKAGYFCQSVTVTGDDLRSDQQITGDLGPFTVDRYDGLALDLEAPTDLSYSVYSGSKSIASVDQSGVVKFSGTGTVGIKVTAAETLEYKPAEAIISITVRDYAAEEAAAEKAATQQEIAKAKSLKAPGLTAKALSGRKIKLTWTKVKNADGYMLYVKYPGSSKFVKAVKRNSTVKSVTHKGLSRYRLYSYKVRAYKVVNGRYYYGPYSKVRKVKAK